MSMRKVFYGPEGIRLGMALRMYDKESLLNYARALHMKGFSKWKKDELAEKIAEKLLTPAVMRRRMAVFSSEQRELLERAMEEPLIPAQKEKGDADFLADMDYAYFTSKGLFGVPVDVASAYGKINNADFQEYAKNMSWLFQCVNFGKIIYGVFDKSVLWKVFNKRRGFHLSREEFEELCDEFPDDIARCYMEKGDDMIIADELFENDEYVYLLSNQRDKDFYIPDTEEVLDCAQNKYLSRTPAYEKLKNFYRTEINMASDKADREMLEIWNQIQYGAVYQDTLKYAIDICGELLEEKQIEKLLELFQNINNNTRMRINRGQTPNELRQREIKKGNLPSSLTVVPGSTNAAALLKDASKELAAMGVRVDFDSNAAVVLERANGGDAAFAKKVYPNDPCPCGSGKKYKKCCGR